jgi:hypothetical protein
LTVPALFTGATNFVKVKYLDADASTRSYALRSGSYYYEKRASYTITVDTTPATIYEAVLANIASTGTAAPMSISYSSRTRGFELRFPDNSVIRTGNIDIRALGGAVLVDTQTFSGVNTFSNLVNISSGLILPDGAIKLSGYYNYVSTIASTSPPGTGIVISTSITTSGYPVLILFKTDVNIAPAGSTINCTWNVFRDGVITNTTIPTVSSVSTSSQSGNRAGPVVGFGIDIQPRGTYTYNLYLTRSDGSLTSSGAMIMLIIELKP